MEVVELGKWNWSWADYFKPGSTSYDIYQVLRESNTALTAREIGDKIGKSQTVLWHAFEVLVNQGLITKSSQKPKVFGGGKATLFALNHALIEKRILEVSI